MGRTKNVHISMPYDDISTFRITDRTAALTILALPIVSVLVAFASAVGTSLIGAADQSSLRFYAAAISYTYLVSSILCLPSYLIAYGWFWWKTIGSERDLLKSLWLLPVVAGIFAWLPATLLPGLAIAERLQIYFILAVIEVSLGYMWIASVRFILNLWRGL